MLTPAQVQQIRTAGLTDTHWARVLRMSVQTIRRARIGDTYRDVPTPPDTTPRDGNGRGQKPAASRRTRWSYLRDC